MLLYFLSQPQMEVLSQILLQLCSLGLLLLLIKSIIRTLTQGIAHLKRLHSIPCHRCIYFTGQYQLKCTVHPYEALTEQAINCSDCLTRETSRATAQVMSWEQDSVQLQQEACYAESTHAKQQRHLHKSGSYQPTLL